MVLRTTKINRRFGAITACNDVSVSAASGEVVALLGENGAGKATRLSIVAGFVTMDSGSGEVDGKVLPPGDPAAAIRAGVGTAFQHFSLSPELDVRENLELARIDTAVALRLLPAHIDPGAKVRELTVPERQQVEFLKARMLARHLLLLDEPTSLLGDEDVHRVLDQIREVAERGTAVIFVTHRLHEALAVADRIVVMRRGSIVDHATRPDGGWPATAADSLLAAMFGDAGALDEGEAPADAAAGPRAGGEIVIRGDLSGRTIDISLERGSWLAVAGIAGNGQGDLVEMLTGESADSITPPDGRELRGRELRAWVAQNIALVPEDRYREGGSVEMGGGETLVLRDLVAGRLDTGGLVSLRSVRQRATEMIRPWAIRPPHPAVAFGHLSGGNAQRGLLARSLDPTPTVLIAVRPTHGLDHHSVAMVRSALRVAARSGAAVVTIEQELDEALRHADRIAVMHGGRCSAPIATRAADREALQVMMVRGWAA
jgi:simple sugar transport system ATP-binding protein